MMRRRGLVVVAALLVVAGTFAAGFVTGKHANRARVPVLLGLGADGGGQASARRALAPTGLRLGRVSFRACAGDELGVIVEQVPDVGTEIPVGSTVDITVGSIRTGHVVEPAPECLPGRQEPMS